jgi:TRAP-type mannitol/chloroaromatic compound transport system permease small subunit
MLMLDRLIRLTDRLALGAIWFAGALMLAAAFLVAFDVLARKLFLVSMGGSDELSGYAFVIGTVWAFAFTLLRRANVRVDALYARLPRRLCAFLDLVALAALGLFAALLTYHAALVFETSWAFGARATTPLQTPLWIPQGLWVAGLILFLVTLAPLLARAALAFAQGDLDTVRRLAGARTIEEDAADEAAIAAEIKAVPDSLKD